MSLYQVLCSIISYIQNTPKQENPEVLKQRERKEKLKEKYDKYRVSIETYVDKKIEDINIKNNFLSNISLDLLDLAQAINCEDLMTDSTGKIFLADDDQLWDYVRFLYMEKGYVGYPITKFI